MNKKKYNNKEYELIKKYLFYILKKVKKAQKEFSLLSNNDKVAIGISGGKDSLLLLFVLLYYKEVSPFDFEIKPIHISYKNIPSQCYIKDNLSNFLNTFGISCDIVEIEQEDLNKSLNPCYRCSWNRRKALFKYCYKNNCNKLALGHHKDDAVETALMNLFFQANLEPLKPKISFFDNKIELIRPLILVPENEIIKFSKSIKNYEVTKCNCGFENKSQRYKIKEILNNSFGKLSNKVKHNIWKASIKNLNN